MLCSPLTQQAATAASLILLDHPLRPSGLTCSCLSSCTHVLGCCRCQHLTGQPQVTCHTLSSALGRQPVRAKSQTSPGQLIKVHVPAQKTKCRVFEQSRAYTAQLTTQAARHVCRSGSSRVSTYLTVLWRTQPWQATYMLSNFTHACGARVILLRCAGTHIFRGSVTGLKLDLGGLRSPSAFFTN